MNKHNGEKDGKQFKKHQILTLTGDRNETRVKVLINGEDRWVPYCLLAVLIQLIIARHEKERDGTGYVQMHKKTAHDLRKALGRRDIIEASGGKEGEDKCEYRLRFLPRGAIQMEETLRELVGMRVRKTVVLTADQFKILRKI